MVASNTTGGGDSHENNYGCTEHFSPKTGRTRRSPPVLLLSHFPQPTPAARISPSHGFFSSSPSIRENAQQQQFLVRRAAFSLFSLGKRQNSLSPSFVRFASSGVVGAASVLREGRQPVNCSVGHCSLLASLRRRGRRRRSARRRRR